MSTARTMALLSVVSEAPGAAALAAQGANLPITVYVPETGRTVTTMAQVDTGSTISGVDAALLNTIGANVIGSLPVGTPGGDVTDNLYDAHLIYGGVDLTAGLPGGVLGEYLPAPTQALIGRDVLRDYELVYDGEQGAWSLTSQTLAPVATASRQLWAGAGLVALGVGLALLGGTAEREHLARKRAA